MSSIRCDRKQTWILLDKREERLVGGLEECLACGDGNALFRTIKIVLGAICVALEDVKSRD